MWGLRRENSSSLPDCRAGQSLAEERGQIEVRSSAGTRKEEQKPRMSLVSGGGLRTDPYLLLFTCPLGWTGPSSHDMTFISQQHRFSLKVTGKS